MSDSFQVMSYKYDTGTTTFSLDGKILQVEYANKLISYSSTSIGMQFKNGIVLASEKEKTGKFVDYIFPEKMAKIDEHIIITHTGFSADADPLIGYMRNIAQRYLLTYNEPIPVEQLVRNLCDVKHAYTQYGGLRPFGISFFIAGYDRFKGCQLYLTDPSGDFSGWRAYSIGHNSSTANTILKALYKENMTATEALDLTVTVLSRTLDSTSLSADKLEFSILQFEEGKDAKVRILNSSEIQKLMQRYEETIKKPSEAPNA